MHFWISHLAILHHNSPMRCHPCTRSSSHHLQSEVKSSQEGSSRKLTLLTICISYVTGFLRVRYARIYAYRLIRVYVFSCLQEQKSHANKNFYNFHAVSSPGFRVLSNGALAFAVSLILCTGK